MKKIVTILMALLCGLSLNAQSGKSIYNKYSDSEDVSSVYISPSMFKLIGKLPDISLDDAEIDLTRIITSLNGFYMIDSRNEKVNAALTEDVRKYIDSGSFEMIMEVKENGETIRMYTVGKGDDISCFILIAVKKGECMFLCLDGHMSRGDLEKIMRNLND